jgi:hypothetical protein
MRRKGKDDPITKDRSSTKSKLKRDRSKGIMKKRQRGEKKERKEETKRIVNALKNTLVFRTSTKTAIIAQQR